MSKYKYAHMIKNESSVKDEEPELMTEETISIARHLTHSHVIDDTSFVYALPFLPKGKLTSYLTVVFRSR